jgi:hypothetical protein
LGLIPKGLKAGDKFEVYPGGPIMTVINMRPWVDRMRLDAHQKQIRKHAATHDVEPIVVDGHQKGEKMTNESINEIPRRIRLDLNTPAELAIRQAVDTVEEAGAHPLLTDAVNLLSLAREKVADFVELSPDPDYVHPVTRNFVKKSRIVEAIRLDESDFGPSTPEECAKWCGGKAYGVGVGDWPAKQWIEFKNWSGETVRANYGDYITRDTIDEYKVVSPECFIAQFVELPKEDEVEP